MDGTDVAMAEREFLAHFDFHIGHSIQNIEPNQTSKSPTRNPLVTQPRRFRSAHADIPFADPGRFSANAVRSGRFAHQLRALPDKFTPGVYTGVEKEWSGLRGSNPSTWF